MSLADPISMGGHFTSMFPEGEDLTWRLIPYILVWATFGVVFLVSDALRSLLPELQQSVRTTC